MDQHAHAIHGRCHCGNVSYTLHTDKPRQDMTVRICRCDFCLRHRPRYWSDPAGSFDIEIGDPSRILKYRFGHKTADFVVCLDCGVFCFAVGEFEGGHRAVTNVNLALARDEAPKEVFLEALAEEPGDRNARRNTNWTPVGRGWPAG
jgi:hypothetical protein